MEESTQKIINENPDSLELGTPAKGGAVKIYGNFSDPKAFEEKISNAKRVRAWAKTELEL